MNELLEKEGIEKEEKVGYLKSSMNLLQGTLYLTPNRILLNAHKTGVGGFGILGSILKRKVESTNYGFDLTFEEIKAINRGKHGIQKNVLEITSNDDITYRIMVKNFDEWSDAINTKK